MQKHSVSSGLYMSRQQLSAGSTSDAVFDSPTGGAEAASLQFSFSAVPPTPMVPQRQQQRLQPPTPQRQPQRQRDEDMYQNIQQLQQLQLQQQPQQQQPAEKPLATRSAAVYEQEQQQNITLRVSASEDPEGYAGLDSWRVSEAAAKTPVNEDEYREWLKQKFQHYFNDYAQGIPVVDFERILRNDDNALHLRRGKLSKLMESLDANRDGRITWDEFFDGVTIKRAKDLSRKQRFVVAAIKAAAPAVKKHRSHDAKAFGSDRLDGGQEEEEYDSYLEAYNCRPPPLFIPICLLAQIIFFIIYAVELNRGPEFNRVGWSTGVPFYSPLLFDPKRRQEAWRFLSYLLLHAGYYHIIFNGVIQLCLGLPLELVHKAWRVGPVFLLGVVGGSLCSSVFDHNTQLVGASGGCYALMGAHLALVVMNWEELQHDWLKVRERPLNFFTSGVVRLLLLLLLLGLDFGIALYKRYGLSEDSRTSFLAHVGGLVTGFLVGIPTLKNIDKKPWEAVLFWISLILFLCLVIAAVLYNVIADFLKVY